MIDEGTDDLAGLLLDIRVVQRFFEPVDLTAVQSGKVRVQGRVGSGTRLGDLTFQLGLLAFQFQESVLGGRGHHALLDGGKDGAEFLVGVTQCRFGPPAVVGPACVDLANLVVEGLNKLANEMRSRELFLDTMQNQSLDLMAIKAMIVGARALGPAGGTSIRVLGDDYVVSVTVSAFDQPGQQMPATVPLIERGAGAIGNRGTDAD